MKRLILSKIHFIRFILIFLEIAFAQSYKAQNDRERSSMVIGAWFLQLPSFAVMVDVLGWLATCRQPVSHFLMDRQIFVIVVVSYCLGQKYPVPSVRHDSMQSVEKFQCLLLAMVEKSTFERCIFHNWSALKRFGFWFFVRSIENEFWWALNVILTR